MASLTKDLSAAASAAFEAMGLEARWGEVQIQMIVDDWSAR